MNRKGFTLVELIVVITILAVLGTISFVSLQGYASEGRDSKRISDVNSIRKVLEYDVLKKGYYDLPENGLNITYSTGGQSNSVWQQGYFCEKNRSNLGNSSGLSKVPKDPLTNTFYSYSILNTKKEIQVGAVLEGGAAYNNFLNETYAEGSNIGWSYIIGNYNGKIAKVTVGSNIYLFALPSITSSDLSVTDLTILLQQNKLSYNGTTKLPGSYQLTSYILNSGNDLIVNNVEQPVTTLSDVSTVDTQELITSLQEAYSGSYLENKTGIIEILSIDETDLSQVDKFEESFLNDMISSSEVPLIEEEGSNGYGNPELIVSSDIKCLDKTPGSTFEVSGITYLVVSDRNDLINNIPNITSSYNLCKSHVTDMGYLFSSLTGFNNNFNKDISSWDTSRLTSLAGLFYDSDGFSSDVSSWDTSSVLDMFSMFAYSDNNSADISSWDVSSVSTMDQMFYSSDFNQDISSWCVSLISSIPPNFDTLSGFEGNSSIQPQWGTCPGT